MLRQYQGIAISAALVVQMCVRSKLLLVASKDLGDMISLGYLPSIWNHYSSSFIVLQQSLLHARWVRLTYSPALPMNGTTQKETAHPHFLNDGKTIPIRPYLA